VVDVDPRVLDGMVETVMDVVDDTSGDIVVICPECITGVIVDSVSIIDFIIFVVAGVLERVVGIGGKVNDISDVGALLLPVTQCFEIVV